MGIIEGYSKWDLENSKWNKPDGKDRKRSFAFSSYEPIFHSKLKPIDYIIFAYGSRVEDHSWNLKTVRENSAHISHMISYFKNRADGNYIIKLLMLDADAPLEEQSKKLASHIDTLASNIRTNSINVIGLSKCGAMNMYLPKYFNNPMSYELINIYNIATPYLGTILASPNIFYPDVKEFYNKHLGKNKFSDFMYNRSIEFYESISSNSHMDYDIAKEGGMPSDRFDRYDENFVKDMLSKDNINALENVNTFTNFTTGIDDKTMKEAIRTLNPAGIGLCLLNDWFLDNKGDGLVLSEEQHEIEKYINVKSIELPSSHHAVNGIYRVFDNVLDTVNENTQRKRK